MTLSDGQFAETIRQRHAANSPFTADEVAGMSDDQYHAVLNDVASMQRGKPERAMDRAQETVGSGLWSHSLEHIGDLTHRMNEPYATSRGSANPELVATKVNSQLGNLTHGYGYDREVAEQRVSNNRYRERTGQDPITDDTIHAAQRPYVLEHSKLPVYNEPGYHAKAAAVHIGLQNTGKAAEHLQSLQSLTSDPDAYSDAMSRESAVKWLRSQEPGAGPR